MPFTKSVPIGVGATRDFIAEVRDLTGATGTPDESRLRLPWWSKSVDSTYLTGKRVFLFGDATHVAAMARVSRDEMGFEVCGLGCYNRANSTSACLDEIQPQRVLSALAQVMTPAVSDA